MNCITLCAATSESRRASDKRATPSREPALDRLTLVTLVIALAGFAGTALALAPF